MGGKDKKEEKAKAKAAKREAARKKKERLIMLKNKVREMEDLNLKVEVDYQEVVNKNKGILNELKEAKGEILQYNNQMDELMAQQEEDVGEIAPEEEENEKPDKKQTKSEGDGDQTPRQEYLSPAELEMKRRKEANKFQQKQKFVQANVDTMVNGLIEKVSNKVIFSHLDNLYGNMDYIVINNNKKAMFKLKKKTDTFGEIKANISKYFGLPDEKIFLTNGFNEILLSSQLVIDELFPLQSSKLKNENPIIYVTFIKNMTTLDYILGDPNQKNAQKKEVFQKQKNAREEKEKADRREQIDKKNREMQEMIDFETERIAKEKAVFGAVGTIMFMFFAVMHVSLALIQYDIGNMCTLNYAITQALYPGVDVYKPLAPRQFVTIYELEQYFLHDVNDMFAGASTNVTEKSYFH